MYITHHDHVICVYIIQDQHECEFVSDTMSCIILAHRFYAGELCLILAITQNGRPFGSTQVTRLVLLSGWGYMVPLTCCFVFWTYSSFNVNIGVLLMIVCDDLILSTPFPSATVKSRKFRRGGGKSLNFWTHQYKFKWLYRFKNYPKDSWNLVAQSTAVKSRGLLRFPRSPTTKHGT
jgi:hypothetical protein